MKEIKESDVFNELNEAVKALEGEDAPYDKYLIFSLIGAIGFAQNLNLISGELSDDLFKRAKRMLRHGIDKCFAAKALDDLLEDIERCDSNERDEMIQCSLGAVSYASFINAISSFDTSVYLNKLRDLKSK